MSQRIRVRRAVWHPYRDHVLVAKCLGGEISGNRGIDTARKADYSFLETSALELLAQERHQPAGSELGIDLERGRASGRRRHAHDRDRLTPVATSVGARLRSLSFCR